MERSKIEFPLEETFMEKVKKAQGTTRDAVCVQQGKKEVHLMESLKCCPVGWCGGVYRFDSGVAGWEEMVG